MKNIKSVIGVSLLFFAVLSVGVLVVGRGQASAQAVQQNNNEQRDNNQADTYDYEAQPGDSYSLIARKAVQTFGIVNRVNLSEAQIVYIETNLTLAADSPELTEGQKVSIKTSDIKAWVDKAEDLSETQEAAWNVYAARADFNTDNVGQSS